MKKTTPITAQKLTILLLDLKHDAEKTIAASEDLATVSQHRTTYLGKKGALAQLLSYIPTIPQKDRKGIGQTVNSIKHNIVQALDEQTQILKQTAQKDEWIDVTYPGLPVRLGHTHIVSQAITMIEDIFARIGFYRVRYPEIDTDWYAFEALNMPVNHPARDEWETFFVKSAKASNIVLTPHTSNGQVREMERIKKRLPKETPPIRMINIGKCYRRQSDISHVPMFHQFEGLYVDTNVSIAHLKGVLDYFVQSFFGPTRTSRIRPFHFQFTEPSFEVDISCDICSGKGCRLCKEGWLELGGAGMVHPTVLKNGGFDPSIYSGFAFGWGVERVYMMKQGIKIDDIRLLYSNDIRFLEQF